MMLVIGDPCIAVEQPLMGPSRERSAVVVHLKSGAVVRADRLLVATGRRPNVEAWHAAGLAQTARGWLKVDPATLAGRLLAETLACDGCVIGPPMTGAWAALPAA